MKIDLYICKNLAMKFFDVLFLAFLFMISCDASLTIDSPIPSNFQPKTESKNPLNGSWKISYLKNVKNVEEKNVDFELNIREKSYGSSAMCNRMFGELESVSATKISFGLAASTMMACEASRMQFDDALAGNLEKITQYKLQSDDLMQFFDANNQLIMSLKR